MRLDQKYFSSDVSGHADRYKFRKHFVVRQLNPMCLHEGFINAIVDVFPIVPVVVCSQIEWTLKRIDLQFVLRFSRDTILVCKTHNC